MADPVVHVRGTVVLDERELGELRVVDGRVTSTRPARSSDVGTLDGWTLPGLVAVVVAAASWGVREFLGVPGREKGAGADLVVYPADPRRDAAVLAAPSAVVLRGRRVA